ncbi:hypothetical protein BH11MYX3_BH11MYX3_04700 [soil metagenome]
MSNKIESQLAELAAQLEVVQRQLGRVLGCPQLAYFVVEHEKAEAAKLLAISEDQRQAVEHAERIASLRARVAQDPWARLVVPIDPDPSLVSVEVDAGSLGRRIKIRPGSSVLTAPRREIESQIAHDRDLAMSVEGGELVLEPLDPEEALVLQMHRESRYRVGA